MPRWGDICVDGWATRFAESAQMSKSSATKIYATAAAALAVKEFFQKILEPTTCAFNPQNISLGRVFWVAGQFGWNDGGYFDFRLKKQSFEFCRWPWRWKAIAGRKIWKGIIM